MSLRVVNQVLLKNVFSVIVSKVHRFHMRLETIKFEREFDEITQQNLKVNIGGTTLDCIIWSLVDKHQSATFGFGFNHIRLQYLV